MTNDERDRELARLAGRLRSARFAESLCASAGVLLSAARVSARELPGADGLLATADPLERVSEAERTLSEAKAAIATGIEVLEADLRALLPRGRARVSVKVEERAPGAIARAMAKSARPRAPRARRPR